MAQFEEPTSTMILCPVCKKNKIPNLTVNGRPNYCSRTCASQRRYHARYQGSLSGPADKPTLEETTKLP